MTVHVDLPGGRSAEMTPMLVEDELAIADLAEVESDYKAQVAFVRGLRDMIDARLVSASWEGGAGKLRKPEMYLLLRRWRQASEDAALPPG